uniref:Uncharacterized protein n=1 Tax=Pristionchus pacificus TaxID=54126 RepID=A0A2A6C2E3_PRIPA|eukprot:PDM72344.1 hypothetical protein PRIPAC_38778 [Pristionchus pacificus]
MKTAMETSRGNGDPQTWINNDKQDYGEYIHPPVCDDFPFAFELNSPVPCERPSPVLRLKPYLACLPYPPVDRVKCVESELGRFVWLMQSASNYLACPPCPPVDRVKCVASELGRFVWLMQSASSVPMRHLPRMSTVSSRRSSKYLACPPCPPVDRVKCVASELGRFVWLMQSASSVPMRHCKNGN